MSPLDPKVSRVIEKANRINAEEKRVANRDAERKKPKAHSPIKVESYRAYRAMYPRKPTLLWVYAVLASFTLYGISWLGEYFPYDRLFSIVAIISLAIWGAYRFFVTPFVWFLIHRGWRSRLPFTLRGWEECLSDSRLLNRKYWRNISITVAFTKTTPELQAAVDAALLLFCRKAWDDYYASDTDTDTASRLHWTSRDLSAAGSADNEIFGLFLELCQGPLSRIARMTDAKMTVTLTSTTDFYFVKPAFLGIR